MAKRIYHNIYLKNGERIRFNESSDICIVNSFKRAINRGNRWWNPEVEPAITVKISEVVAINSTESEFDE